MPLLPTDDYGQRIQALRPGTAQTVPFGVASRASVPFLPTTTVIRVVATAHCFIALGQAPSANTDGHYLPAGAPEYFRVVPGKSLAAVRATTDGALHVSEML
ncbi:hypothetical protein ABMY26_35925 (plasmid) [Azospirillum sp. HJ39]|uniref:hypothetical protein n=1 Tax=Azospirillum sp. HJ39 TaxID=3159496 RepID=UPI0035583A6E